MTPEIERRLRSGDIAAGSYEMERRSARRSMILAHSYEISFAAAAFISSVQFLADPAVRAQTAIGALGSVFGWGWTVLYMAGAVGIIAGMVRLDDRLEVAGLSSFCAAAIVNAAVLVQARGPTAIYIVLIYVAFILGSVARLHLLFALRRIPHVPTSDDRKG